MKVLKIAAVAGLLVAGVIAMQPAKAQFGDNRTVFGQGDPGGVGRQKPSIYLAAYPIAQFSVGASAGGTRVTNTVSGYLIAAEANFAAKDSERGFGVGGWYWGAGGSSLHEIHGKYQLNKTIGVQAGVIFADSIKPAYQIFGLFNVPLHGRVAEKLALQAGLGPIIPTDAALGISAFVNASYEIAKGFGVTANYWYVSYNSAGVTLDGGRFSLGVFKRF